VKRFLITGLILILTFLGLASTIDAIEMPIPVVPRHQANEKIQLQMRFRKGEEHYVQMLMEQKISQTISGQQQNIEQTVGLGYDFDVKNVEANGSALVSYTYRWAKIQVKGAMGVSFDYDSSKKGLPIPQAAQGFAALLGESFSVKITPKGQVEAVEDLETMRNNVIKKLPEGPMREGMMVGLKQFLSEEGIKELTESSMAIYPDKPVGIGDSWSKTVVLSQGNAMTVENTWMLKERKNGISFIEVKSDIKPNPAAKPLGMGSTKVSYELSGKQQGQIEIEESTGQLLRSKLNQEVSGQITMEVAGQVSQQPPIPMNIKGVVTVEMTERKGVKPTPEANTIPDTSAIEFIDPNAVKARIKAFAGLEQALQEIDKQGEKEEGEWTRNLTESTPSLAKAVHEQVAAELNFIRKLAIEERAKKTTESIDSLLSNREEQFKNIIEKIQEERKKARLKEIEERRTREPRRSTRDRGRSREYDRRQRYPTDRQTDPNAFVTDAVFQRTATRQGASGQVGAGDEKMALWIQAGLENKIKLAQAVQEQANTELNSVRTSAIGEKAKKTAAGIDGVLVSRQERYSKLVKRMQDSLIKSQLMEERIKKAREQRRNPRGRIRGQPGEDTSGQDQYMEEENLPRTRRRPR